MCVCVCVCVFVCVSARNARMRAMLLQPSAVCGEVMQPSHLPCLEVKAQEKGPEAMAGCLPQPPWCWALQNEVMCGLPALPCRALPLYPLHISQHTHGAHTQRLPMLCTLKPLPCPLNKTL